MNIIAFFNIVLSYVLDFSATKTMVVLNVILYIGWIVLTFLCFLPCYYLQLFSILFIGVLSPFAFGITDTVNKYAKKLDPFNSVQDIERSPSFGRNPGLSVYQLLLFVFMFLYAFILSIYYHYQACKLRSDIRFN